MPGPPELTDEQRRQALAKAAEARRVRAEVKEQLKAGSLDLAGLLELADADQIIAKMKVVSVLESLPRLGKVKSRRAMDEIGINGNRRLRGLGSHQRAELLARFG
ncbi:MAG: integration host factor [Actinobacteria bacterium]|nr:integration host factor [Actinomycetota bacterium]